MVRENLKQTESDINKKLIWEQLLNSNPGPDNTQLCHLVIHSGLLRDLAIDRLLKQNPTNSELYWIMRDGNPDMRKIAFERLCTQENNYKYIVSTIIQIPELREQAWQRFIEIGPQGKELRLIAEYCEDLKEACWEIILTLQISNGELLMLMETMPNLRNAAWERFLNDSVTNMNLCRIMKNVKELRQKAWTVLMKRGATNRELRYLIDHVPAVREIAEYKLHKETEEIMMILNGAV